MAYSNDLEEKVKKYCEINNIPINRGQVSGHHKKEIENFVIHEIRRSRKVYAKNISVSIKPAIKLVIGDLNGS